ncbi:hypothetical protein GBA52_026663 [Prunus armeniaca]|nr:hypothetical protein GBA52_026663 [Prunus armeniaca]
MENVTKSEQTKLPITEPVTCNCRSLLAPTLATTAASWFPFPPDQISVAVKDCFCKNYFNYFG